MATQEAIDDVKDSLESMLEGIPGWMDEHETAWLNEKASQVQSHVIVEIGSYCGRSGISLAKDATVPVFAIDPHKRKGKGIRGDPEARRFLLENIVKFKLHGQIRIIDLFSDHAQCGWTEPISFLFIDGDHARSQPIRDVNNWYPHLVVGGIIAMHDKTIGGVKLALELLDDDPSAQQIPACGSIQAYQKVSLTPLDELQA